MSDEIENEVKRLATDFVEERLEQVAAALKAEGLELKDKNFSLTEADLLVYGNVDNAVLRINQCLLSLPFVHHGTTSPIRGYPYWWWVWFNLEPRDKDLPRGGRCDIVLQLDPETGLSELRFDTKMTAWRDYCASHGLDPYVTKRPSDAV